MVSMAVMVHCHFVVKGSRVAQIDSSSSVVVVVAVGWTDPVVFVDLAVG